MPVRQDPFHVSLPYIVCILSADGLQHHALMLLRLCCCGRFQGRHNRLRKQAIVSFYPKGRAVSSGEPCAYLVKHVLEFVLRQGTALDVLDRAQLLGHTLAVFFSYGLHLLLCQLVLDTLVFPQIDLCANYEAWNAGAVVVDLGEPFLADVFEGCGGCDTEANEEDVGLRV